MPKPTQIVEWAKGADALITEPPAGKKSVGANPGEPFFAQYWNWLLNRLGAWSEWARDYAAAKDEANTFTDTQTFAGPTPTGASDARSLAAAFKCARLPYNYASGAVDSGGYALLMDNTGGPGTSRGRIFRSYAGQFLFTSNAYRSSAGKWQADVYGTRAFAFVIGGGETGVAGCLDKPGYYWHDDPPSGGWTDAEWTRFCELTRSGVSPALLSFHALGPINPGDSMYLNVGASNTTGPVDDIGGFVVPVAGTISEIRAVTGLTTVVGQEFTIYKNGSDIATITVPASESWKQDNETAFNVEPGDRISVRTTRDVSDEGFAPEVWVSCAFRARNG